jgi:hypothetical protein
LAYFEKRLAIREIAGYKEKSKRVLVRSQFNGAAERHRLEGGAHNPSTITVD